MPTLTEEAKATSLMSMLLKQIYDTISNGGPDALGPNDYIAFDPVGLILTEDTFNYALKGLFNAPPAPKPQLDGNGKPILDEKGRPLVDMETYKNLLTEGKFRAYLQMEQFADMVDIINEGVPPMQEGTNGRQITILKNSGKRVSQVYEDLLQWSIVVDTPLDPKVEKNLNKMRDKLFKVKKVKNPDFDETAPIDDMNKPEFHHTFVSPMYSKYVEYEMKYYDMVNENNEIRTASDNGDPDAMAKLSIDGKNMKKREDSALKAWQSLGYKEAVERIQNYLSEIEEKHMLIIKKRLQSEFRNSQRTKILDYTNYSPSIPIPASALKESKKWTEFRLSETSVKTDYSKSIHNWGASTFFSIGFFTLGGGNSGNVEDRKMNIDTSKLIFRYKLGKVRVGRGWFNQAFVESKYWKLHESSPQSLNGDIISDGAGKGLMPSIITDLIVVRDVAIDFSESTSNFNSIKSEIDSAGGIGIGPFAFGGNYSYANQNVKSKYDDTKNSLVSSAVYIIGYQCHIVPKSPNPNPDITLWTDGKGEN